MEKLRLQFLLVFGRRFILPAAVGAVVGALIGIVFWCFLLVLFFGVVN